MSSSEGADYLFVYGTLRRGADHEMAGLLSASASHEGEGRFQGRLYRVSWYPCAVASTSPEDWVRGDVFRIEPGRAASLFTRLDAYEGTEAEEGKAPHYRRERHAVEMPDGRRIQAWVYVFNRPTAQLERIASGDFLNP